MPFNEERLFNIKISGQIFSQIFLYFSHIRINMLTTVRMNDKPVIIKTYKPGTGI